VRMSVCGQMGRSFVNGADYELVVWTKKNRSHIRASYQGTISFRTGGFNEPYARAGPDFMTQMHGLPYSTGEAMEVCTFVYVHVCTFDPCRRQVRTYVCPQTLAQATSQTCGIGGRASSLRDRHTWSSDRGTLAPDEVGRAHKHEARPPMPQVCEVAWASACGHTYVRPWRRHGSHGHMCPYVNACVSVVPQAGAPPLLLRCCRATRAEHVRRHEGTAG